MLHMIYAEVSEMEENEGFTTIRVPVRVKEQAEELRSKLQKKDQYSWLGTLALGAVLGYALSESLKEDND